MQENRNGLPGKVLCSWRGRVDVPIWQFFLCVAGGLQRDICALCAALMMAVVN